MNENNIDVSLIVPVFNAERYLNDCLESVEQQIFNGVIEVILVNDGGTDACDSLCVQYKKSSNNNVTYIRHEKNKGVSAARNSGLDIAKGKYVSFLDADDVLPSSAIYDLFKTAEESKADIVKGNIQRFNGKTKKPMGYSAKKKSIYTGDNVLAILLEHEKIRGHSWGKLFLRKSSIKFPLGVAMAEDLLFCVAYFKQAKKLVIIPNNVYRYRNHGNSVTDNKYKSGVYLHWLNSVSAIDGYLFNKKQKNAYKILQIRTLFQAAYETWKSNDDICNEVILEVMRRKETWGISTVNCFLIFMRSPRTFFRYVKLKIITSMMQ